MHAQAYCSPLNRKIINQRQPQGLSDANTELIKKMGLKYNFISQEEALDGQGFLQDSDSLLNLPPQQDCLRTTLHLN